MAVNYTPNYENINGNFKTLKPFRFWCQKVLPLVYDDSLSYYELLNKVVDYLNGTMEDVELLNDNVNTLDENVRNIYDAYNSLQSYVNNYFDNLDVQEEINNKLDAMATDGTLSNLINTIAVPLIPGLVEDWLEENIEPTTPIVDATLSISGAAADAKKTGDEISGLKNSLDTDIAMIYGDNLLSFPAETVEKNGVTYVANGETVTANGTPTANSIYRMQTFTPPKTGDYRLTGCPEGGATNRYYMRFGDVTGNDTGSGVTVHLTKDVAYTPWIVVYNGYTVTDLVFTPTVSLLNIDNFKDISARIDRFDEILNPIPLYGAYSDATGAISVGTNFSTLLYSGRTNIAFIKAGSTISNMSGTNTVLSIYRYRSYDIKTFINFENVRGSAFTKTITEDGYYAFAVRRNDYAQETPENLFALLTFDLHGHYSEAVDITFIGTGTSVSEAIFITFPNGKNLLIDSDFKVNYTTLKTVIYTKGYKTIDNFILSHYHNDHVGGIIECLNRGILSLEGANVYLPDEDATQWAYDNNVMEETTKELYVEFNTLLANINCNIIYPSTEYENYKIDDAVISFFNTDLSVYENVSTNYNDWSLCNYVFYGNMNACFTGDIGPIAENHLATKLYKANVYKAEHHGWANVTTIPNNYIDYVSPDVIIACDGQAHDQLLQTDRAPLEAWAEEFCVPYYRTYQNGDINITLTKNSCLKAIKSTLFNF